MNMRAAPASSRRSTMRAALAAAALFLLAPGVPALLFAQDAPLPDASTPGPAPIPYTPLATVPPPVQVDAGPEDEPEPPPERKKPSRRRRARHPVPEEEDEPEPDAGPPAPDGGGRPDAAVALPAAHAEEAPVPITYHEEVAFTIAVGRGKQDARGRARDISRSLSAAIEADKPDRPDAATAAVQVKDGLMVVRVRGYQVALLYPEDATAAGYPSLETYAENISGTLQDFVPSQIRRGSLQQTVLHLFLSVFIGLVAVVVLRQLRAVFDRADEALADRKGHFAPLTILRVPVLSGEAVFGALAFLLDVGRWMATAVTSLLAVAAIMSQFAATRPKLREGVAWGLQLLLNGVQKLGSAVPQVILAMALVLALHGALRVAHVLLDGVKNRRIDWNQLPPERVPLFRRMMSVLVVLLAAPLVVAAAFGGFGSPIEKLALGASGVGLLGAVPTVANWLVGLVIMWRGTLAPGDWVDLGGHHGEVTRLSFSEICLVPEDGGTIHVPMLRLLFHPMRRMPSVEATVRVLVVRDKPAKEVLEAVRKAVAKVAGARVEVISAQDGVMELLVRAPSDLRSTRQDVWLALCDAADREEVRLAPRPGPAA